MREEYLVGILESPTVIEEAVPEQLRCLLGQAFTTLQQLPEPIKDTLANGLRIPLGCIYYYMEKELALIREKRKLIFDNFRARGIIRVIEESE